MQIIELYIKTGGYNGTGTAINTSSISDFSIDFIEVGAKIGDSILITSFFLHTNSKWPAESVVTDDFAFFEITFTF